MTDQDAANGDEAEQPEQGIEAGIDDAEDAQAIADGARDAVS